jgi:hypothetical protein
LKGKGIPQHFVDIFIEVFNSVFDKTGDEGAAYRQAHGVLGKELRKAGYRQGKGGRWQQYKKKKEDDAPDFVEYTLGRIIAEAAQEGESEEDRLNRHKREGMKFHGVALRDDTISQQGSGFERWYSQAFCDLCLENTIAWVEMGNTPTIFNRHDSAGGGFFSTSTENPIGKVTKLWREGEEIRYEGFISPTEKGQEVIQLVHDNVMGPTSVRIYEWQDREEIFDHNGEEMNLQVMEDGRIGGIDFCEQPGIPGAGLIQVMESQNEEAAMAEEEMTSTKLKELYPALVQEWCAPLETKVAEMEAQVKERTEALEAIQKVVEGNEAKILVAESAYKRLYAAATPAVREVAEALLELPEDQWASTLPNIRVKAALKYLATEKQAEGKGQAPQEDTPDVGDKRPQPVPEGMEGLGKQLSKLVTFLR